MMMESLMRQDKIEKEYRIIFGYNNNSVKWFLNFLIGSSRAYGGCLGSK